MPKIPKRAWLLTVVSGILQVLVFPSPALYFLCWIALAPLIVAIIGPGDERLYDARGRDLTSGALGQGLLLAWVNGVIFYAGTCFWIFHTLHVYGGMSDRLAVLLMVLFLLAAGMHHGVFGLLLAGAARARHLGRNRALMLAPFFWVTVEILWEQIVGFPWQPLGTAQVDNIPLSRIATWTGVYGLSFEIVLVNAAFAAAFLLPRERRRMMLAAAIGAALILQLGVLVKPAPSRPTHVASLVQHNIPILEPLQWTYDYYRQTLAELAAISTAPPGTSATQPGLILWPESPSPFFLNDAQFRQVISSIAQKTQSYVVVGGIGTTPERRPLNSAALVAPDGAWVARYDKIHLVPFGEYVPGVFFFVHKITKEAGDFARGTERTVFDVDGYKLGVFICYESVFPDEVRIFAGTGAQLFANISNDEWFGPWGAPAQHLNMVRMRAIENQRWVLRATNTGFTVSIDPYGRVVSRALQHVRTTLEAPFGLQSATTFYTRHGDWFAWGCAIISLLAFVLRAHVGSRAVRA
ncbi:MAG TPA: apolipoprotein N-acyltransferase [Terriglobales bacterium]|nr:apolipoprotein N-acyltransferase [Terriglobales bacterium]